MKTKLLLLLTLIIGINVQAQDGYTFSLVQNSGYNYSVVAVPDYTASAAPNLESFSLTIMIQDGGYTGKDHITLPYGSIELTTTGEIPIFTAAQLDSADPGNDRGAYVMSISSGSFSLPMHNANEPFPIVTFDILGSPTTGEVSILDNGSSLAMAAGGQFDSFMRADTTGGFNPILVYEGQSGTTSYSFATLTVEENELTGYSIFPNPANDVVTIKGLENTLSKVEVFNIAGQKVYNSTSNMETINVSTFNAGVYFVKLSTEEASLTTKLIKE
ncbi:T9SS type A sorting domain-containing protein [Pontimicrobium sp. MEBiC01747]